MAKLAACIGGGVIGGGWVARFLLHGWDVNLFDPAPDAERKVNEVLNNARRSLPRLADVAMPKEGRLTLCKTLAQAVEFSQWIQESVPEQLSLKHKILRDIQSHCPAGAIIGSSTSGFKPSELQMGSKRPEQILVAHPFNPVYLLPLVELVASEICNSADTKRAEQILSDIGMKPLVVGKEIEAHIADRLLEAVWREGLWLIKDDIATTEEIDDAIRFGFGLRWAQMGLFETYRIAGGEAGMAHFIAQFGPALAWPWTKLMDVPELTDALIQKIADQSDAQSGSHSIRELERIRDENLVGIMRVQKENSWGVGEMLKQHDQRLMQLSPDKAKVHIFFDGSFDGKNESIWIDDYGYLTDLKLQQLITDANDQFCKSKLDSGNLNSENPSENGHYISSELHIRRFKTKIKPDDKLHMETRLLGEKLLGEKLSGENSDSVRLEHNLYRSIDHILIATSEASLERPTHNM